MKDGTLGRKVSQTRLRRSMTQEELAERAGVSTPLVYKIEQGKHNGSIATIYKLAEALRVPAAFLFEEGDEVEQDHALLLPFRDVFFSAIEIGITASEEDLTLPALRRKVLNCVTEYDHGRYEKLANDIPPLIRLLHIATGTYENEQRAEANRLLFQAYDLASRLLIQLRDESLGCVAAERAMRAADDAGDAVLKAEAGLNYWWAFKRQKRFDDAETIATRLAAEIEPSITRADPEHLAVWGALLGAASIAATHSGHIDTANDLLSLAHSSAVRIGERRMDYEKYWAGFNPTTIAITRAENALILRDAPLALHLSRGIKRSKNTTLSDWARHLLVVAEAQTTMREYGKAIESMKSIRQVAPEWVKNHRVAHDVVLRLLDATTVPMHKKTGLDKLAAFMGVEP